MAKKEPKTAKTKPSAKEPKKKKGKAAAANNAPAAPTGPLTPEQEVQVQLEQAIKESNDPSSRLKKLKSPLSVGGCLLNLLFLVVLTIGLVYLILYFQVDKFNFVTVTNDMFEKLGISGFFRAIGDWFKKVFGGGQASEIVGMLFRL